MGKSRERPIWKSTISDDNRHGDEETFLYRPICRYTDISAFCRYIGGLKTYRQFGDIPALCQYIGFLPIYRQFGVI